VCVNECASRRVGKKEKKNSSQLTKAYSIEMIIMQQEKMELDAGKVCG
jgi:hypothetical protein